MPRRPPVPPALPFSAATRAWFEGTFDAATPAQTAAWSSIARGENTLVVAPTGSGKTLAAFLWSIDRLAAEGPPLDPRLRCRVLYVSPLKALAIDVERNLRAPLAGIREVATARGEPVPTIEVAVRSGDTPASQRRRIATRPPDILITTPESLYLLLTSGAREALRGVETVIVDEVHAVAGTKRGAHLALSLERLDALLPRPAQRIGLSATVRPVEDIARFLGGPRDAVVVRPPSAKTFDIDVAVPVEDMTALAVTTERDGDRATSRSIWPHVAARVAELVSAHRSTIVFANSRRAAERLTGALNEIAAESGAPHEVARAHHGSVSREQRDLTEHLLKSGELPAVVATSTLELGIDMGAVDLVVQVGAPPSVASGVQRIGRAGHQVGAVSRGVVFPQFRGDLAPTAVVAERMRAGAIERTTVPRNPLDVLAQQAVAAVSMEPWTADDLFDLVRQAAPFADLPRQVFDAVLDMLAGRYPSDDFADLRPRLVWDRVTGELTARPGAQRLAVTSGGTIPDRGLYGVYLAGEAAKANRVGELDEEMVFESRVGEVFRLGSSSWRIEEITHDRVLVSPAPGRPGKLPFWHGDNLGRPAELGAAIGAFTRELAALDERDAAAAADRLTAGGFDTNATTNLLGYLREQRAATGALPDDRTIVVERCRDELGDWRLVIHSPLGARVHAPWALILAARFRERYGIDVRAMGGDDGIVLRLPDMGEPPGAAACVFDPDDVEAAVTAEIGGSALFAGRFRECAARALLLPRARPGKRMPLWQQRQRSAQLLGVASGFGSFPIVAEAMRECLLDVYDVPALVSLMGSIESRDIMILDVETPVPSPFARSLLFGYVMANMYVYDTPIAERRALALSLDTSLLTELLGGTSELRELVDADALADVEADLQRSTERWRLRDAEDLADALRVLGPLSRAEVVVRGGDDTWLTSLVVAGRAIEVQVAGEPRWAAVEDAARLRDALGAALPPGIPAAFLEPVADPLADVVMRFARTHGPFTAADLAARYGLGQAIAAAALTGLTGAGRLASGAFLPGGSGVEFVEPEVLRLVRRRSLAALRSQVEPVPPAALGDFLPRWQGIGRDIRGRLHGADGVLRAVEQLAGAAIPASALERLVLPARVPGYTPAMLDELTAAGEVVWAGAGALPGRDGWVRLCPADVAPLLLPVPAETSDAGPLGGAILATLAGGGQFFRSLADAVSGAVGLTDDGALSQSLWAQVWAGLVTNDTLAPLRAFVAGGAPRTRAVAPGRGRLRGRLPSRTGPPAVTGRWALLPAAGTDPTRAALARAEALLDRYGVVTRGAVAAEGPLAQPGGFAAAYRVLSTIEDAGQCRRGYFVEGLGAAQFALPGAIERLRGSSRDDVRHGSSEAVVLAAADPANPYGAALEWPATSTGQRPARKAGAIVVLVGGEPVLYAERGGSSVLTFTGEPGPLASAASGLAAAARDGRLARFTLRRIDGADVRTAGTPAASFEAAGFTLTPSGMRPPR